MITIECKVTCDQCHITSPVKGRVVMGFVVPGLPSAWHRLEAIGGQLGDVLYACSESCAAVLAASDRAVRP